MATNSSAVSDGNDGTAAQYNNLRKDAITKVLLFHIPGTLAAGNEQGPAYIVPENATVKKVQTKIKSGTNCAIRLQKDTTNILATSTVTTTVASVTSFDDADITADQVITLDIVSISGSPADLTVQVTVEYD